tara:strand:- start:848 stop:1039 length:192 start_codon:yes stop_codon:yes gene_type:complete
MNPVPVIVQFEDGSCIVQFPDGPEIAATGIEKAHEVVDYYFESDKPQRRIGFVVSDDDSRRSV